MSTTAVPREQLWGEGCVMSTELLAVVSGGASSAALQELSSTAVVEWLAAESHPSPGLLLPLLASASRSILHLNHRNPILQAGLLALFSHGEYCAWWMHACSLVSIFHAQIQVQVITSIALHEAHIVLPLVWFVSNWIAEWCGWESEVTWPRVLSLLSFPLTNPAAMLTLAAQVSVQLTLLIHNYGVIYQAWRCSAYFNI